MLLARPPQGFQTAQAGHPHVGDHQAEWFGSQNLESLFAGGGQDRLETLAAEKGIEQTALTGVIIDNQDTRRISRIFMKLGRHVPKWSRKPAFFVVVDYPARPVKEDYKPDRAQGRLFALQKPTRGPFNYNRLLRLSRHWCDGFGDR